MRNALKLASPSARTGKDHLAQSTGAIQAANVGSDWQFLTVAVPAGDPNREKSWFKREGSSDWQRIDTFAWPQLAPLFPDELSPANDDTRVAGRKRRRWGRAIAKLF